MFPESSVTYVPGLYPGERLTGVAADGEAMECAQALAPLVSSAQFYWFHRN